MIFFNIHFSRNIKNVYSNVQKNHFCQKANHDTQLINFEALNVYVTLIRHLNKDYYEAVREKKPMNYEIPNEIRLVMYGSDNLQPEKIELEITEIAQNSIVHTMNKIINRIEGSQKGIMYPKQYFKELGSECYGISDYVSQMDELKKKEYLCFELAEDICNFIARSEVLPSTAIRSFIDGPTAADCASTVQAVYLNAVLDVLGEEKFDKLFKESQNKLRIRRWGCMDEQSSLFSLTEFLPQKNEKINENELSIGDYVVVPGVPFYSLKHPYDVMSSLHSLVMTHDTFNQPIVAGLELNRPISLREVKQFLLDAYNAPIDSMGREHFDKRGERAFLLENNKKNLGEYSIFKHYSIEEAEALGSFKIKSVWRLSATVLKVLKEAPIETDNLTSVLHKAKALALARQFNILYKKL